MELMSCKRPFWIEKVRGNKLVPPQPCSHVHMMFFTSYKTCQKRSTLWLTIKPSLLVGWGCVSKVELSQVTGQASSSKVVKQVVAFLLCFAKMAE